MADQTQAENTSSQNRHGPHIWQVRAVRDCFWIILALFTIWLMYALQAIVVPVLLAFVLAYLVDPVIRYGHAHFNWSREMQTIVFVIVFATVLIGVVVGLIPTAISQSTLLAERFPDYSRFLAERLNLVVEAESTNQPDVAPETNTTSQASPDRAADTPPENRTNPLNLNGPWRVQAADAPSMANFLYRYVRQGLGLVGAILGLAVYFILATILMLATFAYFSWHFNALPNFKRYLPESRREEWWALLRKIELIFAGFLRGQLIVALFTFIIFSIGFYLANVPFWFLVAAIGGAFSIIPYGQASGWILAVAAKYLETQIAPDVPFSWLAVFVWPTLVYVIMQSSETLIITPWVQSWSTRMHPLAVFAAIVGGGSLGGVLGMFLAIPIAASGKVILRDVVAPRLAHWADQQ